MSAANDLFETLRAFRTSPEAGKTPQQLLVDYCQNVLGGVERLHFDFKTKSQPVSQSLDDADKKNLAKAISGFANETGGVLIWGLNDTTIVPNPISNVSKFVNSILQLSHQVTAPAVSGIDGDFVTSDDNPKDGFGLIFVPESDLPPHRVLLNIPEVKDHYFKRTGSSFSRATHSQLEDMFGRRPRPALAVEFELDARTSKDEICVVVLLENKGRGIARYPFLSLEVEAPFGLSEWGIDGNGKFGLPVIEKGSGLNVEHRTLYGSMKFGSQEGFAIHSGMRHPITKIVKFAPNNGARDANDLSVRWSIAAEGTPLRDDERVLSESELTMLPKSMK